VLALAGCDEPEPPEALLTDAVLCAIAGIFKSYSNYDWCIWLNRADVSVRHQMAKDHGVTLIDCLHPDGGMLWATREECSKMMGISIDH
jgi:hypothetical protein